MKNYHLNLTERQIKSWNKLGYLLRPKHLKENIKDIIKSISNIEDTDIKKRKSLFYYEEIDSKPRLCRIEKFIDDNKFIHDIVMGDSVLGFVRKLLNKPVYLYKEKINIKHTGGSGYAAHQDATAYHKLKGHITCLIAVTEMTLENGCLYLSKVEHKNRVLPHDKNGCIIKNEYIKLNWIPMKMYPGDCLFFNSFIPHKSYINYSSKSRKAIYLTFNDASEGNLRKKYYAERDQNLKGNKDRISTIGHFQGKNFKI